MPTPHNSANKGDYAEAVLLPGDPLRAKWIAETFLADVKQVNAVRNCLGFTGTWEGRGGGGFQGTMWMGQPGPAGPGKPGVTIRVRIRGGWTQGKIWGTYSYTVFDASGAVQTQGTGSFSGRPIDA